METSRFTIKALDMSTWDAFVALVEANEPRLIAFHIFVNEDGTQATTIQVHPDAASMAFHMQVIGQKISERMRSWSGPNASRSMERPATRSWR